MSSTYVRYPGTVINASNYPLLAPNGSAGAPSYSFSSDSTSGMWYTGGFLSFSASSSLILQLSNNNIQAYKVVIGQNGAVGAPAFSFASSLTTGTYYDSGTSTFRIAVGGVSAFTLDTTGTIGGVTKFSAPLGIGSTSSTVALYSNVSALTGGQTTLYAVGADGSFASTTTGTGVGFLGNVTTAASAFTMGNRVQFYAANVTKGAGSTISNDCSFYSEKPSQGTTGNAVLADNLAFSGSYGINLTSANKNLLTGATAIGGTTTNDNALAGFVGEAVRADIVVGSAINIAATVTWQNITSISLTAGDWDVSGIPSFGVGTGTGLVNVRGAISINSGTTITDQVWGDNMVSTPSVPTGSADIHLSIPSYRISLSGTTTVYLKGYSNFSGGTPVFYGRISARRVR